MKPENECWATNRSSHAIDANATAKATTMPTSSGPADPAPLASLSS